MYCPTIENKESLVGRIVKLLRISEEEEKIFLGQIVVLTNIVLFRLDKISSTKFRYLNDEEINVKHDFCSRIGDSFMFGNTNYIS